MPDHGADDQGTALHELKQLRRGRGLHGPDVGSQIGPLLSAVAGVRDDMDAGQRRLRLIDKLESTLLYLPGELQTAARVALGLHADAQSRFLADRMTWLAGQMDRNERTAARRVDDALNLLAERLVAGNSETGPSDNGFAPSGWYVESQQATVMVHQDPVRVHEVRRVRCTRDGLSELTVSWSVPLAEGAELRAEIMFGGTLTKDEGNSTTSYWSGRITLPQALLAGDEHTVELLLTITPGAGFQPYYVLSPFRRCDELVVRCKFAGDRRPEQVWDLDRVPFAYVNEDQPLGELLEPDGAHEITRRYTKLAEGFSYGMRWRFPPT